MPLIKKASKKALEHNIKAEMEAHPDKRKQDLAIAFSVQRKAKKKMAYGGDVYEGSASRPTSRPDTGWGAIIAKAEGGAISASDEKRPMPENEYDDAHEIGQNSGQKTLKDAQWTDVPKNTTAQRGPKYAPMKHPKMVPQNAYSVKIRGDEDDLEESAKPASPSEEPAKWHDEKDATKSGPEVQHMKMMADGGKINDMMSMKSAEYDADEHPAGLEEDDDMMAPSASEYMSRDKMAPMLAEGGSIHREEEMQPMDEEEEEHHNSIAAAIMSRKSRKAMRESGSSTMDHAMMMADGGQVDLDENAMEEPNQYYQRNQAVLKENYDEPIHHMNQPMDSNEHGDIREDEEENEHDMIGKIRSKMNMKRQFGK